MRRVQEFFFPQLQSTVPILVDPLDCLMLLSADLVTDDTLPHSRQLTPGPLPARGSLEFFVSAACVLIQW